MAQDDQLWVPYSSEAQRTAAQEARDEAVRRFMDVVASGANPNDAWQHLCLLYGRHTTPWLNVRFLDAGPQQVVIDVRTSDAPFGADSVANNSPGAKCPHCGRTLDEHGICPDL